LFELVDYLDTFELPWSLRLRLLGNALLLPRGTTAAVEDLRADTNARHNSRRSIAYHYDVSNDFYRLWLDPEMVYSCAYFKDAQQPLAEAQRDKLDYICRKLRLAPGQRLLDIGCGWGALVSWAARHYGVQAHGITLSDQQYEYARERIRREGLEDRVRIELRDYRDLAPSADYDRIVSVGMFEHIGIANFPTYFDIVRRALKPDGLFLNHGVTSDSGWEPSTTVRFINRYVFPDAELAPISDVCTAMEQAGFELIDMEGLRPHYALTLRRWVAALEQHREEAIALMGEPTYRLWRLYMAGTAHYFDRGTSGIYQILAGRVREPLATPLRRDDLYR
ncbi:MAG TPA: cyclopropane-fatty-acyl-phospholipid synthase family protein, partial [Gammaproteobacteria bacterium]|nr:cyclopropane-fatty-acyl-phospholipid synthase family protein [Gammaproteobacteria bacterium]